MQLVFFREGVALASSTLWFKHVVKGVPVLIIPKLKGETEGNLSMVFNGMAGLHACGIYTLAYFSSRPEELAHANCWTLLHTSTPVLLDTGVEVTGIAIALKKLGYAEIPPLVSPTAQLVREHAI